MPELKFLNDLATALMPVAERLANESSKIVSNGLVLTSTEAAKLLDSLHESDIALIESLSKENILRHGNIRKSHDRILGEEVHDLTLRVTTIHKELFSAKSITSLERARALCQQAVEQVDDLLTYLHDPELLILESKNELLSPAGELFSVDHLKVFSEEYKKHLSSLLHEVRGLLAHTLKAILHVRSRLN